MLEDEYEEDERVASEKASGIGGGGGDAAECPATPRLQRAGGRDHEALAHLSPTLSPTATATAASTPTGDSVQQSPRGRSCVACTREACTGVYCALHKRVSDNVYNDEKKFKTSDPDRWAKYNAGKKKLTAEYIGMLVQAEVTKGGAGRGVKTSNFNAMQAMETLSQSTNVDTLARFKLANARIYLQKAEKNWGWSAAEAGEEFKRLLAATPPDKVFYKPTLPGKEKEPWIYCHFTDEIVAGQGLTHTRSLQLTEQQKKKPTAEDIVAAEGNIGSSGSHFSDNFFKNMSSSSTAILGVKEGVGSAVMDGFGRSAVMGEAQSHRDRGTEAKEGSSNGDTLKKRQKTFDLEDAVDSLGIRLQKKYEATLKYTLDCIRDIDELISNEPGVNKAKMARFLGHLESRSELVRMVSKKIDSLPGDGDGDLTFNSEDLDMHLTKENQAEYALVRDMLKQVNVFLQMATDDPNLPETTWLGDLTETFDKLVGEDQLHFVGETLKDMLAAMGWAGSGFDKTPDLTKLAAEMTKLLKMTVLRIEHHCRWSHFVALGKPLMEADIFKSTVPMEFIDVRGRAKMFVLTGEDSLKTLESDYKAAMDQVKTMTQQVRQTLSAAQKHSRELRREEAKTQTNQEKDRDKELKQREKDEKARLRQIADQMKGNSSLPGLLSYCGEFVKPMRSFKDAMEYKSCTDLDSALPFVISDVQSLRTEETTSAARVNFQLFKAGRVKTGPRIN